MNKLLMILSLGLLAATPSRADGPFSQTFTGGAIPNNPVGAVFTGDFTSAAPNDYITGVTVDLDVTGGVASGLYAYLIAPDNTLVVLLMQPGVTPGDTFGNLSPGINLRLAYGATPITAGSDLNLGIGSPYAAVDDLSNFGSLASPGGLANGTWELFFANLTGNGETPTLNSWTLNVDVEPIATPEPGTLALGTLALLGIVGHCWLRVSLKNRNSAATRVREK